MDTRIVLECLTQNDVMIKYQDTITQDGKVLDVGNGRYDRRLNCPRDRAYLKEGSDLPSYARDAILAMWGSTETVDDPPTGEETPKETALED
jgi:hypothetical protein|nr:MAG TPA: protein of unknown function (DUF4092) [Caudoviricetes sp.]